MPIDAGSWEVRRLIKDAVEKRHPRRQSTRDMVFVELLLSLASDRPGLAGLLQRNLSAAPVDGAFFPSNTEGAAALAADDSVWQEVEEILFEADYAVMRQPDDGRMLERWTCPPLSAIGAADSVDPSAQLGYLTDCAIAYVKAGWAKSPALELWLARQMIFAEASAFDREMGLASRSKGWRFWWNFSKGLAKWLIGTAAAISIAETYGPGLGLLGIAAWLAFVRYLAQDQIEGVKLMVSLSASMRTAYTLAIRNPACPAEVERAVLRAERIGVVWPAGLSALIGKARARNPAQWI